MRTIYEERGDGTVVAYEFSEEQAAALAEGRPVGWYGDELWLADDDGAVTVVRSAADPPPPGWF